MRFWRVVSIGICFLCCAFSVLATGGVHRALVFEENCGQASSEVRYIARTRTGTLFLTDQGAVFHAIALKFAHSSSMAHASGAEPLPARVNYFRGRPESWHVGIVTYGKVAYQGVAPGIDAVFHEGPVPASPIEFDLIAAPHSAPEETRLIFATAKRASIRILLQGDLTVTAGSQTIVFHKPLAWQKDASGAKQFVDAGFLRYADNSVGFRLGAYDKERVLTIDPVISYSTFLGGTDDEGIWAIKRDSEGNIYVAGETTSADFPIVGPVQDHVAGNYDAFVSKFDATGTQLIYSTYLGGSAYDGANALAVDSSGNVYVAGRTGSADFPLMNPLIATEAGNNDAFVAALEPTGSRLIFSTYLGGKNFDSAAAIAIDDNGDLYVAGTTRSLDFPTTPGSFQEACAGVPTPVLPGCTGDAFITKIDKLGSRFIYSTYLGGSASDSANGLVIDSLGHAYVAGGTGSADFPTKAPYSAKLNGNNDAFITEVSADGSGLIFSTYFGGSSFDTGTDIGLDLFGNIYLTGLTSSKDLPVLNAFQPTYGGGTEDAFVAKFTPVGDSLIYASYLGGSGSEGVYSIRLGVDAFGSISVTGATNSADFPTVNPIQSTYGGGISDLFIAKVSTDGSRVLYSTYLGGAGDDHPYAMYSELVGSVWVGGSTASPSFPVVNAFQQTYAGGPYDAYLTKIELEPVTILQTFASSLDSNDYSKILKPWALAFLRNTLKQAIADVSAGDTVAAARRLGDLLDYWDLLPLDRISAIPSTEGVEYLKQAMRDLSTRM